MANSEKFLRGLIGWKYDSLKFITFLLLGLLQFVVLGRNLRLCSHNRRGGDSISVPVNGQSPELGAGLRNAVFKRGEEMGGKRRRL